MNVIKCMLSLSIAMLLAGCSGQTELLPNSDKNLRKTPAQFAADAARRFPFRVDLPSSGEAQAGAQVDYTLDEIYIRNLSGTEWTDVELWVNRQYVVFLPVMQPDVAKTINFRMLYNVDGQFFPLDNNKVRIEQLEMIREGKLYTVPMRLRD
jgi:hypothetical protein